MTKLYSGQPLNRKFYQIECFQTHLWTQCAADTIHSRSISTPPHQCPIRPSAGWRSCSETCQGNSPSSVSWPLIIRPFRSRVAFRSTKLFTRNCAASPPPPPPSPILLAIISWCCWPTAGLLTFLGTTTTGPRGRLFTGICTPHSNRLQQKNNNNNYKPIGIIDYIDTFYKALSTSLHHAMPVTEPNYREST